jgi:hypothetical protein
MAKLDAEAPADEVAPAAMRRRVDPSPVPPAPVTAHPAAAPAARPAADSNSAASSEKFMARLEMMAEKQKEYHAHLIRDGNQERRDGSQARFRNLVLKRNHCIFGGSFLLWLYFWLVYCIFCGSAKKKCISGGVACIFGGSTNSCCILVGPNFLLYFCSLG